MVMTTRGIIIIIIWILLLSADGMENVCQINANNHKEENGDLIVVSVDSRIPLICLHVSIGLRLLCLYKPLSGWLYQWVAHYMIFPLSQIN